MPDGTSRKEEGVSSLAFTMRDMSQRRRAEFPKPRAEIARASRDSIRALLALRDIVKRSLLDAEMAQPRAWDALTMQPLPGPSQSQDRQNLWAFISGLSVLEEVGFFDEVLIPREARESNG